MSARSVHGPLALFLGAVKSVLRELPRDGTGLRVDPTPVGHVTVTLLGPDGPLATCIVAQRAVPRGDGRQLTIDDVLARGAKPPAPAADTPPAASARSPATVADDRGEDWGEDGREYPDGPPYAVLRVTRGHWQRNRRALGAGEGGAHHGDWRVDGDYRTLTVSASQLDALFAALGPEGGILRIEEVGDLLHRHREHDGCDEAMRIHAPDGLAYAWCRPDMAALDARGELADGECSAVQLGADWSAVVQGRLQSPHTVARIYRDGVCIWDSRDPGPPPAYPAHAPTKPAKGKLYRDQGHGHDRSHAHPNVAYLAGPGSDMERPKGLDDAAWRALVAQTITEAPAATWRLYSSKGKCLWDSRDGGAP